jgi:hypothetical protein
MHKNAMKCNKTLSKWYKNKHEASKIIDTFETYHSSTIDPLASTAAARASTATIRALPDRRRPRPPRPPPPAPPRGMCLAVPL